MKSIKSFGLLASAVLVSVGAMAGKPIPLVYDQEFAGSKYAVPAFPTMEETPEIKTLPNPFEFSNSTKQVKKFKDWEKRRAQIVQELMHYELGFKPLMEPGQVKARMDGNTLIVDVDVKGKKLTLSTAISYPSEGDGPFPLMISCDGSGIARLIADRGVATCTYQSNQVNTKSGGFPGTTGPFDDLYPEYTEGGAYIMTSWGVSRLIDGLQQLGPEVTKIDITRLGVTGCSYAGKMALYAGAFDERIALTVPQEPGGGGAAAWRVSETLGNVENLGATNHGWFIDNHIQYAAENTARLPFDQHELVALCCPRAILIFGNADYEWLAEGADYVSCVAARKVWEKFGIEDRMGFSIDDGHGHCQLPKTQYDELFAFVDKFLLGKDVNTSDITNQKTPKVTTVPADWMPWAK